MIHCFLIAALTADGFIGRDDRHNSTRWTSAEDYQWFTRRSKEAGVVVMGRKTYETIGQPLKGRTTIVYSRESHPEKMVENQSKLKIGELYFTQLSPKKLLQKLGELDKSEVGICGGSSIYTLFMKAGVVETLYLTIEPVLFGQGVRLFKNHLEQNLTLIESESLSDQTLLLAYQVE